MFGDRTLTKEQLLKAIEQLERNPTDKLGIFADIGIAGVGAALGVAGAGTLATAAGATSIPVLTTVGSWVGVTLVGATPIGWVVGTAAAGAAVAYGVSRLVKGSGYNEGKTKQLLIQLKERSEEVEAKERTSSIGDEDKTQFHILLKEPVRLDLISPKQAQDLITAVENGQLPLKEAYKLVQDVIESAK
ncbi:MAG TPA: hypothetical protein V6D50_06910 [Chroococcales cyanobacterium]|jgi:hypothetical protein